MAEKEDQELQTKVSRVANIMFHFRDMRFLKLQQAIISMDMVVTFCASASEFEAIYKVTKDLFRYTYNILMMKKILHT
jgi:hypothetical protein